MFKIYAYSKNKAHSSKCVLFIFIIVLANENCIFLSFTTSNKCLRSNHIGKQKTRLSQIGWYLPKPRQKNGEGEHNLCALRCEVITRYGLVTPHGNKDLCQPWFNAVRQQAITWTNIDFLFARFFGIHSRVTSLWMSGLLVCIMGLMYTYRITSTSPGG